MDPQPPRWEPVSIGILGAHAQAKETSMRIWFCDGSAMRFRGVITLEQSAANPTDKRLTCNGSRLDWNSQLVIERHVQGEILLPPHSEWSMEGKPTKFVSENSSGRSITLCFASGVMFDKINLLFPVEPNCDQGKFFIKAIKRCVGSE